MTSLFDLISKKVRIGVGNEIKYIQYHIELVIVLLGFILLVVAAMWLARTWIRANLEVAKLVALHVIRLIGLFTGGFFVLGALSTPKQSFGVITDIWNDPVFWVQLGLSDQFALLLTGVLIIFGSLVAYELGQLVEIALVRALLERLLKWIRR